MIGIEKLDRYIFYTMCVFAFTTCINHIVANNVLAIGVLLAAARCYQKRPDFKIPQGYGRALGAFFAGILAALSILWIKSISKLKEDAVIGFIFSSQQMKCDSVTRMLFHF